MNKNFFNRILHLLDHHPQKGKRLLGISSNALWELWQRITPLDLATQQKLAHRPGRKRQAGGGRKKSAMVLCRLLVALLYLRQHWTMQGISQCINCAESTVFNYIHEMLPYIREQLPASLLEQWKQDCRDSVKRAELEQWLADLPEGKLLVDTWEQPIPRPEEHDEQKRYYSGKQKKHTHKNQLISLPKGIDIVNVVLAEKGPRNDGKLLEQTQAELPDEWSFVGDKAYVGRERTTTPYKKPKGGKLTKAQKDFNKQVSQKRVYVEHIIRVIKNLESSQRRV